MTVAYDGKSVLENVTCTFARQQLVGIIGPNGAGKSTFIKAVLGMLPLDNGEIKIMDGSNEKIRSKIAYVPQRSAIDLSFPVLVEDVVMMGRFPHITWWGRPKKHDKDAVEQCLEQVGMLNLRRQQIGKLSGGQLQRVFLARALAQEADIFFLDEPFSGIDIPSEQMIMHLLRKLRNQGKTIFVVHHDLSKAGDYFDSLLLLNKKVIAYGHRDDVFRADRLREAYEGKAATFGGNDCLLVVNC